MNNLDQKISEFRPENGVWLPLEDCFEEVFSGPDPRLFYPAIFRLFERFPEEDGAGVFWSALHGMEAIGRYDDLLLESFKRAPSTMTEAMLRRTLNSGQTHIGIVEIASVLPGTGRPNKSLDSTE